MDEGVNISALSSSSLDIQLDEAEGDDGEGHLAMEDVSLLSHDALRDRNSAGGAEEGEPAVSPIDTAGFISTTFFSFVSPLIALGYQRDLTLSDMPALPEKAEVEHLSKEMHEAWLLAKDKYEGPKAVPMALWPATRGMLLFTGICHLLQTVLDVSIPVISSALIAFIDSDDPASRGWLLLLAFVVVGVARLVIHTRAWWALHYERARIHVRLKTLIYRKSLTLQNIPKGTANTIHNVDPDRIGRFVYDIHWLWLAPTVLLMNLGLLWYWMGPASLGALAVMLLMVPINRWALLHLNRTSDTLMKLQDKRVDKITEIVEGILTVKLFGWEASARKMIDYIRGRELRQVRKFNIALAALMFVIISLNDLWGVVTFSGYQLLGNELTAAVVFPALMVFSNMRWPVILLPGLVNKFAECRNSVQRVNTFLRHEEIASASTPTQAVNFDEQASIELHGSFRWRYTDWSALEESTAANLEPEDAALLSDTGAKNEDGEDGAKKKPHSGDFELRNVHLSAKGGELIAVVGAIGSGKTALLNAMLGELEDSGAAGDATAELRGSVAYCAQQAWIRNATFRDNVLFGLDMDRVRYQRALEDSSLVADLSMFKAGDLTEIGSAGVNLSGGQKARVSLARALYQDADIYLLDDPLSAVDAHVGHHIFHDAIIEGLRARGKLVILVTHQLQYLPACDSIIMLDNGSITGHGTFRELVASGVDFSGVLADIDEEEGGAEAGPSNSNVLSASLGGSQGARNRSSLKVSVARLAELNDEELKHSLEALVLKKSTQELSLTDVDILRCSNDGLKKEEQVNKDFAEAEAERLAVGKLVEEEEQEEGTVSFAVYWRYLRHSGSIPALCLIFATTFIVEACAEFSRVWLSWWTGNAIEPDPGSTVWLSVYVAAGVGNSLVAFVRQFKWAFMATNASRTIHDNLLTAVLRAPMSWFYKTPTGRITARFSKDMSSIDDQIPDLMSDLMLGTIVLSYALILMTYALWWTLFPAVLVIGIFTYMVWRFRPASREIARLESKTHSPIYAQYGEVLNGLETIRAVGATEAMRKEHSKLVQTNSRVYVMQTSLYQWLFFRAAGMTLILAVLTNVLGVVAHGSISGSTLGLLMALVATVSGSTEWLSSVYVRTESQMSKTERIFNYTDDTPAEAYDAAVSEPPASWPASGAIIFNNVTMRYSPEGDAVLKKVSFAVKAHEKIGIVGRTGAGKSSLINALFRIVEIDADGAIEVDGKRLVDVSLHRLRRAISIIPQDPVLFSGTLRDNVDPFQEFDDSQVLDALQRAHLGPMLNNLENGLEHHVTERGANLSVGQRQLICLSRALLRNSNILVMDEATASVDPATDALIQETIRMEFAERTVLTIAHRINTIIDSDRILLMAEGEVAEFDTPVALLRDPTSEFYKLIEDTGPRNSAHLRAMVGLPPASSSGNDNSIAEKHKEVSAAPAAAAGGKADDMFSVEWLLKSAQQHSE